MERGREDSRVWSWASPLLDVYFFRWYVRLHLQHTCGEHESAKENTNQALFLKAQEVGISRKKANRTATPADAIVSGCNVYFFFHVCFVFYFRRVYSIWSSVCPGIIRQRLNLNNFQRKRKQTNNPTGETD